MTSAPVLNTHKRKRLLNQMLLLAAAAAGVHLILDLYQAEYNIAPINVVIMAWLLFLRLLNKKGYHQFVRYTSVISMSLILLFLGSLIPKENGLHLLFLPLICVGFIIFDYEQYWAKAIVSIFILSCYSLLEVTDFRLLGDVPMLEEVERIAFITNFLTSGILLFLTLSFIARANHTAQQHLEQMGLELQLQNKQLSKANEELDRFVYSTSHDLRAPLLSVLGLVQLLETKREDEPAQPYLNMMRNRVNKLVDFINDITAYSRNARLPLQPELFRLDALADDVISSLQYLYQGRQLELRNEIALDQAVPIDRQRVLTILNNLVSNAIKYHRVNHPDLYVAIGARLKEYELQLWVSDNGPGIAPAVQERMFDMFYRGDERSSGSGLGLYIVKEAIEKLKGSIKANSTVGQGSTFLVRMPLLSLPPENQTLATAEANTEAGN